MSVETLRAALAPRSVAIVGASDNPHKVGGRPILYLKRYGFRGAVFPVNPVRTEVQGLKAYPDLAALPEPPDLAIVAVGGEEALRAVQACAERGVRVAVVMASGFGETGEQGRQAQQRMLEAARAAGMRLIGPNCQGLANFATGVVANFSTIFHELEGHDGPVAIVSQSGANSQAIYALLRQRRLGVRHVHATGNEADVAVADLAAAIVEEPEVRLLLLYLEAIKDPAALASVAERARERDLPVVALKAGRTASGKRVASTHTGALATEDRVVDAFFERHAIWRASDPHELVQAAKLYISDVRPRGRRLVFISNSGASCVMAADYAEAQGIPLAPISESARTRLAAALPGFASAANPIDVTGALLGNPHLFSDVLPILGEDALSDLLLVGLPVAGTGYDVPGFARDLASFARRFGHLVAVAAPQDTVREAFAEAGIATFSREREAMDALAQIADHAALRARKPVSAAIGGGVAAPPPGREKFLNEAESMALLEKAGLPVIGHRLCLSEAEARAAAAALGPSVALKACSRDVPHKSDQGLVALGLRGEQAVAAEFERQRARIAELGARFEGVLVARMASRGMEVALGARLDAQFGPVVMVGDGGIFLEALKDFVLLMPPFSREEVLGALGRLRIAPLFNGVRGRPARDREALAQMAVRLGEAMLAWRGAVAAVDINPVIVFETGRGALAVDALIERVV
jgi:acyl-CoA synthetase (NDP forming)